ncbi:MAG TPA: cupredoxin domain-containing protein [Thermoanaerobaculia bacterium]
MKRLTLIFSIFVVAAVMVAQESPPRIIAISAKRFEFTPNEITLERGERVTLRVKAEDRDHGFFQKELGLDLDLSPERVAEVTITPQASGRFVAICDNFCGSGHGNMKMVINVE